MEHMYNSSFIRQSKNNSRETDHTRNNRHAECIHGLLTDLWTRTNSINDLIDYHWVQMDRERQDGTKSELTVITIQTSTGKQGS